MTLNEAKAYIGKQCEVCWSDRCGREQHSVSHIYDVTYVPLYGGYVVTNEDDIRLDRVVSIIVCGETPAATPAQFSESKVAA